MEVLSRHAEGLWSLGLPHRMMGLEIGARTTIVRMPSGGLVVISPGPFTPGHVEAIRELGSVEALVAPNSFHHLFLGRAAKAFPRAQVFLAPGLRKRIAGLPPGPDLGDEAPPIWSGSLEQALVRGTVGNEVIFFHPSSGTLIVTDLAFNIRRGNLWTRIGMSLNGGWGKLGTTRVMRSTIRDKVAFAESILSIASWDFDRVIVAHGDVVETGGRSAFARAFALEEAALSPS